MNRPTRRVTISFLIAILIAIFALPIDSRADVAEGIDAFLSGNRITAWRELLPAARAGDAEAQFYVGTMYRHGFGTETDSDEGHFWLTKAAAQGHARAKFVLGFDAIQEGRPAADNIVAAAQAGFAPAQYFAGVLYRDGNGVAPNNLIALGWFLQAAEQDHLPAQYAAASLLAAPPQGVRQDVVAAYQWLVIAAHGGFPAAVASRDSLRASLTPKQIETAQTDAGRWISRHR
ncbi:MAG: tetratricopeptide repeat protein [Alphaproteobacteria bacterium]